MKKRTIFAVILAASVTLTVMAGCTKKETTGDSSTPPQSSSAPAKVATGQLSKVYEAVKTEYGEDYIPSMAIEEEQLEQVYGIPKSLYKEVIAEGPMISNHIDIFMGFEAVDEKAATEIETKLNAYRESYVKDSMQYPMNIPKVNSAVVKKVDDYVFFLMLGNIDAITTPETEEEQLKVAEKEVKRAVDQVDSILKK